MTQSQAAAGLQPLLDRAVIVLQAPTQVWSDYRGEIGATPIDGVYHADVRHLSLLELSCSDSPVEWIASDVGAADHAVFTGLVRGLDDTSADPKLRLTRDRRVTVGSVSEVWTLRSHLATEVVTELVLRLRPDYASLHQVKAGCPGAIEAQIAVSPGLAVMTAGPFTTLLTADGAAVRIEDSLVEVRWQVRVPPQSAVNVSWRIELEDSTAVVQGVTSDAPWNVSELCRQVPDTQPGVARWLRTALGDLAALRMALPDHPEDEFYAAGAPWFFTLFGRDSLWAARLMLPVDRSVAVSTLRVLARRQGTKDDPATAEQPGKILHELRSVPVELPGEGVVLPPLYYGTVDATPLWVCLLVDTWRAGLTPGELAELLPALQGALDWILRWGDSDGDGFLDYLDRSGTGLSNQGWKDSGDSIQWRDGTLAAGPIALCEVQAYAYEAALGAADLIESVGESLRYTPAELRQWAAELRSRFAQAFWVTTPEGRYPAIALDRDKRPVDSLTSNIGHLIGTGILDPLDEAALTELLTSDSMSSGFGIRTLSMGAAGYWPLSYHGGSVWTHDTAIAIFGLARSGLAGPARQVAGQLVSAAEGFGWRVPELHGGDAGSIPVPYPAACRPQAWSAAAAVTAWDVLRNPSE